MLPASDRHRKTEEHVSAYSKLRVNIPVATETLLSEAVASGEYASTEAIVEEALRDWSAARSSSFDSPSDVERLRQLWDEGIESGFDEEVDIEAILREARLPPDTSKS
jgi:antitoxin ParD1/3/4